VTATNATVQKTIATSRIVPDPEQPRKLFEQAGLDELAASMRELGQLQAITVRYDRTRRLYIIVAGERRWRAANMAGLTEMYAMVLQHVDDEEAFIRSVAENVGRVDMTPIEEARAFQRLVDAGWSTEQIAARTGASVEKVGWRMDLLTLIPAAMDALSKGHLPVGLAWYVSRLEPTAQSVFLGKWGRGEFPTIRDAEAFVQACRAKASEQFGLFGMEEPSVEERAQIIATRQRVASKVDQLAKAGEILHELGQMDPAELAKVLAGAHGGVDGYQARISHLQGAAAKAAGVLRKAKAIVSVSALDLQETSAA